MTKPFLLLASTLLAAPSLAQPGATPPVPSPRQGMTLDQFLARQTDRIMAADTDGDGRVSKAEMAAMPGRGGRDPSRLFDRMDANHDGYLDKNEIQAMLTQHFRSMDRNGDGVVTPDERMAGRGRGAAGVAAPATSRP